MIPPFEGFRVYTLERYRVYLPKEISELLPWYSALEECDALGMPSPHGGIVVLSPEARRWRDETLAQLEEESSLMPDDLASDDFARALRLRATWSVRIGGDGRFTLPEDARDAGMVPSSPDAQIGVAVVMGAIQVWGLDELPTALRTLAGKRLPQ